MLFKIITQIRYPMIVSSLIMRINGRFDVNIGFVTRTEIRFYSF